jgi:peptidoglycan/LPS O-acetylase OafA/YrhL
MLLTIKDAGARAAGAMLSYRKDIEGLRALSVLAVVVFHINPKILPGGFIGVDVFFVISGYLITGILWRDMHQGRFCAGAFYARRVRRLFPALFAMLLACLVAAFFIAFPSEMENFAGSLIASVFYVSNLFFVSQSDYFASDLELSPLLHTWSLSVEEQFYLVFPFLLLLIYRHWRQRAVLVVVVLGALSLLLCEWLTRVHTPAAFFLVPARFFQFLAGSLIALAPLRGRLGPAAREGLLWAGLGMIAASLFLFSGQTRYPGLNALLPTAGAALAIYAGQWPGVSSTLLLSNPLAVFFGRISYSLYLWHWPIVVFYRTTVSPEDDLHKFEETALFAASILAGYLSWRCIERPTKKIDIRGRTGPVLKTALAASLGVLVIGVGTIASRGAPSRFEPERLGYIQYLDYDRYRERQGVCFLVKGLNAPELFDEQTCIVVDDRRTNVLLVGDSHAAHFIAPLRESLPRANISQVNASGCEPTIDYEGMPYCTNLMRKAFEHYASIHRFDAIILSAYWQLEHVESLRRTVNYLAQYTDRVIVFGPILTYDQALPRLLARFSRDGRELAALKLARNYQDIAVLDKAMKLRLRPSEAHYVSILDALCPGGECRILTREGIPLQWDYGHLTHLGGLEVVDTLLLTGMLQLTDPAQSQTASR